MSKTAIITGITGQDGSYLARLLLEKNYKVIGLTRNTDVGNLWRLGYLGVRDRIKFQSVDLTDFSSVAATLKEHSPDEVYHLAAQSSVGESFKQPIGTITFNTTSVLNLLESMRLVNPDIRYYQASSSEMYGHVKKLPVTLDTPMHPLSPYAISKACAHWCVINYRESFGLYACCGVLFNHESYLRPSSFFLKKVIHESVRNRFDPNWKLPLGNLSVKRDFGWSKEYVEAMYLMLQQPEPKDYLICSGQSVRLKDLVDYVFEKLGLSGQQLVNDPSLARPTDIADIFGDNTLAFENLGWRCTTDFYTIVDKLIEEEIEMSDI